MNRLLKVASGVAIGIISSLFLVAAGIAFYFEMGTDATFFDFVGFDRFTLWVALSQPQLWEEIAVMVVATLGLMAAYDLVKGNRLFYWWRKEKIARG